MWQHAKIHEVWGAYAEPVRQRCAIGNHVVPQFTLGMLDPDVRLAVASNPMTPPEVLQRLAADSVNRVAARAGIGLAVSHILFTNERSLV